MFYLLEELIVPKHAAFSSLIELCFTLLTNTGFYKSSIDFDRAFLAPARMPQHGLRVYQPRVVQADISAMPAVFIMLGTLHYFDLTGFK